MAKKSARAREARRQEKKQTSAHRPQKRRLIERRLSRAVHGNAAVVAAGLVVLSLLFCALTFQPTPHTGGDNAAYITLGRSLLERHAYLELYDPAEPPHTQYPPVFPGILAIAMAAGLQPWVQLKILIALFAAAAVCFSFLWIRRRGRPLLALGVATLLALAPGVLVEAHWILSDVPFWAMTLAAVWALERMPPRVGGRFAFAVVAIVLAYFTRSAGLPLVIAACAWLIWRKRWTQLAIFIGVLVPLAILWWLRARTEGGVDYVSQFLFVDPYSPHLGRIGISDLPARMASNAVKYLRLHLPILLTGRAYPWMLLPSLLIVASGVLGWARRLRRPAIAELFLPLYIGLLLVWPAVWSGERFLLPVLPVLLYYAGDGLAWLGRKLHPRAGFLAAGSTVVILLLAAAPALTNEVRYGRQCTAAYRAGERYPCLPSEEWRDFFNIAESTRETLPENAVVISRKPRLFYVLSDHPSRIYPFSDDAHTFFRFADTSGARHLVFDFLDRPTQAYVRPILLSRPAAFCLLYGSRVGTTVFGILPGASTVAPAADPTAALSFAPCPEDYWRSAEARERLMGTR